MFLIWLAGWSNVTHDHTKPQTRHSFVRYADLVVYKNVHGLEVDMRSNGVN